MALELRCPAHPGYRAIRKPKVNCPDCLELYQQKGRENAYAAAANELNGNNNRVEEGQGAQVAELGGPAVIEGLYNPI